MVSREEAQVIELARRRPGKLDFLTVILNFGRRKPLGAFGAIVLLVAVICAAFAPQIAPYGYNKQSLADRLQGPSAKHIFGTDHLGRDYFSRIVFGARISIVIGLSVITLKTVIALLVGGVAGHVGGRYDLVIQRFVDAFLSFPSLIITLTLVAMFGQGMWIIILVLSISTGMGSSRVVRSAVIAIRENQYIEAARAIGASEFRIFAFHIVPNIVPVLVILGSATLGGVILAEASLSFLGFGVPPPQPTWGGLLTGTAANYMLKNPWLAVWPGVALSLTVFSANMLGDTLRDALDPRLRGSQ